MSAYDLILKGGHVIDPANQIDEVTDVAIKDGRIARVRKSIPLADGEAVVDVADCLSRRG